VWIVRTEREVSSDVPAAPSDVRAFYTDLHQLMQVHPLVVSVDCIDSRQDSRGDYRDYRVRDRIPLGPLTMSISYRASVLEAPDGRVHTEACQQPQVRLSATVTFNPIEGGTRVTEHITIAAPRPLAGFTVTRAVQAHTEMLAGIRSHFEGATA
jgi:hypothetical protein